VTIFYPRLHSSAREGVAPLAQLAVDDIGKGKRVAESSAGGTAPKAPRIAGGSSTGRGKDLGSYIAPGFVGNPAAPQLMGAMAPAIGVGVGPPIPQSNHLLFYCLLVVLLLTLSN
jgi:hypothetical protein